MFSASHRKRSLKKTKLFVCTCERCLELNVEDRSAGPSLKFQLLLAWRMSGDAQAAAGAQSVDLCRGFRCPHCGMAGTQCISRFFLCCAMA